MLLYTLKRLLLTIPTLIGVAVLVFFMLRVVPGDIVEVKLRGDGGNVTQEVVEQERKRLGLDRPLLVQFGDYMLGLAKFDLGISMWTERPVIEEIMIRLELSLEVAILATIFATIISIPLGTLAALYRNTWIDYVVRIITIGGLSIPSFWFGMIIMLTLLALFNWLPPITFTPIYVDPVANLSNLAGRRYPQPGFFIALVMSGRKVQRRLVDACGSAPRVLGVIRQGLRELGPKRASHLPGWAVVQRHPAHVQVQHAVLHAGQPRHEVVDDPAFMSRFADESGVV